MKVDRRTVLGAATSLVLSGGGAQAQRPSVKIGVLADFSGLYTDMLGKTGVECARQAVLDFAPQEKGFDVEIVFGDHLNKADNGAAIVRRWFDSEGVDMMIAGPNSSVQLAASFITREKNKVCCGAAVVAGEFTGKQCTPNTINWTYDAYMLSKGVAGATVKAGGTKWYFISTDNAFGASLQAETSRFIRAAGGQVMGSSASPVGTADFSALLLAASASGANVLALAIAADDLANALKQANEFGLTREMRMSTLVVLLNDIQAAGLATMQGLTFINSFYWDLNDRTRAFTKRVLPRLGGVYPGMVHAGCYGVTMHYLKAVAALGVDKAKQDGARTVAQMKAIPTDDDAFGPGSIRADGRAVLPAYLLEVKAPSESRQAWDACKVLSTIAPLDTVRPIEESDCPLVKR